MGLIFGDRNKIRYEDTEAGKRFKEKLEKEAIERAKREAELERNTTPERKKEVKYMKIVYTIILFIFLTLSTIGYLYGKLLTMLLIQIALTIFGIVIYIIKPKKIKYIHTFLLPVTSALLCSLLWIGFTFFNTPEYRNILKKENIENTQNKQE